MTNYDLLKQKIQEAIPSLRDFTNGCIIETPHWNIFKQKLIWKTKVQNKHKIMNYAKRFSA